MTWFSKLLAISNKHDVNLDFTMPFVIHLALSVSKPTYWSIFMIVTCYAHLISMARISENQ